MPTVREFFVTEANDYLRRLDTLLQSAGGVGIDSGELHRIARGLRGSAQMAREERVQRVAHVLEAAARSLGAAALAWGPAVLQLVSETLNTLQRLVADNDPDADIRMQTVVDRWRDLGLALPETPGSRPRGVDPETRLREFRTWVAAEANGILNELNTAISVLQRDPSDREPLKALLRRQRALLGAKQLESVPVVHQALNAVDEITRLIARLNTPVVGEWIEPFRLARDVLGAAIPHLQRQEDPQPTPALAGLRQLHQDLTQRHGAGPTPAAPPPQAVHAQPADVLAMFRKESAALLGRIERMAGELAAAPPNRQAEVRRELRAALAAVRDTARTFGFPDAAAAAERGIERAATGGAMELLAVVSDLREAVGEVDTRPAAAAPAREARAVPIESLLYRGEAALRRALELEPRLRGDVATEAERREAIAEVFDLIRLGLE